MPSLTEKEQEQLSEVLRKLQRSEAALSARLSSTQTSGSQEDLQGLRKTARRIDRQLRAVLSLLEAGSFVSTPPKEQKGAKFALPFVQQIFSLGRRVIEGRAAAAGSYLDPAILWQIMGRRYPPLLSSSRRKEALARHQVFLANSAAYREAYDLGDRRLEHFSGDRTEIAGLQWWVPADKGSGALASRMLQRHWLPLGQILSSRALAVGGIMLDIGANIGTTSIPRAILGDFQYIYAAEPEPLNYLCLVQNVVANGLAGYVLPDQVAISSSDGEAELIINTRMANHHLSLAPVSSDTPKHQRSTKVPCLTLDSWVSALGIDLNLVTFIKSDAQGWEGHILRGASQVLRNKHIAWQIEFWPSGLKKANFDLREIAGLVRQHFTHFVDLRGRGGPQIRQTSELLPALSYLIQGAASHTDLLLYNAAESPSFPLHKKASSAAT